MGTIEDAVSVANAAADYQLSTRGAQGLLYRDVWGPREKSMGSPWSLNNPDGTIILRLAENSLMHDEVGRFIKQQVNVLPVNHLTYSTGPRGSHRLRRAAAAFWTDEFNPREPIGVNNVFVTPGLSSAIDALIWAICDEGDAVLIPLPLYNGFNVDVFNRSNARIIGVPYTGVEGYSGLDDLFDPEVNRWAIEMTLQKPPETLEVFASICGEHGLHLISDEIYAKSVFPNPAVPNALPFVSTLSLDLSGVIDKTRHHVLYGASKDFCANGLRLGFVCTQNQGIMGALSSISIFSWSPHVVQDMWAAMLEDQQWLQSFMERKLELMVDNHKIATSFFRHHGIRFYDTEQLEAEAPFGPHKTPQSSSTHPLNSIFDHPPTSFDVTGSTIDSLPHTIQQDTNYRLMGRTGLHRDQGDIWNLKTSGVQLGVWVAEWYESLHSIMERGGKNDRIITVPLIQVLEGTWTVMLAVDEGNELKIVSGGQVMIGNTNSLMGMYQLQAAFEVPAISTMR
ncbi:PLP-dependent transferase [Fusarium acutatum]|uniref:PLP-dependent transferase n=1 Tax=Fusarium acutatum TaxID=78861 RepID=A0A8H4JFI5_9HYPO|nr:PLP-dependent transferase [Fusarium acutatum]